MIFFWLFISFVVFQRLAELFLAKRNERVVRAMGAIEFDKDGYRFIVLMHILFFLSTITEHTIRGPMLNPYWRIFLGFFIAAQFLRYWAILSLGKFWNTKILVVPGAGIVSKGPYRYFRHPNYAAVSIEIACIPLIFSCYITALIFSLLNVFLISRRTRIENKSLNSLNF